MYNDVKLVELKVHKTPAYIMCTILTKYCALFSIAGIILHIYICSFYIFYYCWIAKNGKIRQDTCPVNIAHAFVIIP